MRKLLTKKEAKEVLEILEKCYPDAQCELNHNSPFELLVATILSAQCTDVRVNIITSEMFKKYNTPMDYLELGLENIEELIKSCGFYRNKAKSIYMSSKKIIEEFNGEVPQTIEELMTLPGVGKKTANVVASTAYGVPAIAVDTHVFRLANRIGFVDEKDVESTEIALEKKIEKSSWTRAHHLLIFHGRRVCKARNPLCGECKIRDHCRYYLKEIR
ncbi:endonuclease III [Anaerosphaera multitolerans]|uniref:Endonuclease III n=1 Tax=Anaerosphaera multitolerans TaxID=2487351 RepID=A0A437S696_9FIRM|nr:endonuclease III [Anaerosphaera multitolerans]RVU54541.1 endonuclease III [Anaerosphaera multitolerans]